MSFKRDVTAMMSSAVAGQAIALLFLPIFTRLYSPEAIGLQALFLAWAGSVSVLATLKLDIAIVLPRNDDDVHDLWAAILVLALTTTATATLVVVIFGSTFARLVNHPETTLWLWLLPLMVLAMAATQTVIGLATRQRSFGTIAASNVGNNLIFGIVGLTLFQTGQILSGLVVAKLVGQISAALLIWKKIVHPNQTKRRIVWSNAVQQVKNAKQFVYFNTPYSLLGGMARDIPIFVFSLVLSPATAAYYALARTVTLAPVTLVSVGFGQVFFKEAADRLGTPTLEPFVMKLLKYGLLLTVPVFAGLAVWADFIFGIVFGEKWVPAGTMAMALAPALWLLVQSGWQSRMFEVTRSQHISLAIQVVWDAITIGSVTVVLLTTHRPVLAVVSFAVCHTLYNLVYLYGVSHVSGFDKAKLARTLATSTLVFVSVIGLMLSTRLILGPPIQGFALSCLLGLVYLGFVWTKWIRPKTFARNHSSG